MTIFQGWPSKTFPEPQKKKEVKFFYIDYVLNKSKQSISQNFILYNSKIKFLKYNGTNMKTGTREHLSRATLIALI